VQRVTRLLGALAVWTVIIWLGRIRNVAADETLSDLGRIWRLVLAVQFLALAALSVAVVAGWWRNHPVGSTRFVTVFCLWTMGFWAVRGLGMLFADHDAQFKLVHSLLAAVSIGLAGWLYREDREVMRAAPSE